MASFSSWNGAKMHGSRYLLTDVLKGELGFSGFVVSDWAGIDQLPGDYSSDVETAVNAGIDMVMLPDRYPEFVSALKGLVQSGRVPLSRIDYAVRRILTKKVQLALFDKPRADRSLLPQVGSDAHRQVGREAVRKSLVLLKNDPRVLPLSKMTRRIHVAGRNADDLGNQCGGWTITWQGGSGAITTGTTILQGIRAAVLGGASVTYSRDGSGANGADVGVVVIGETPYAEGVGDRSDLSLAAEDVAAVRAVRSAGVPTVVVLVSGRPLILGPILADASAIVAAWLPGTEGDGVADVLFGDFAPTGKLSHSWPRTMAQIPLNWGDAAYDPLYPYGHGLSY
jgi:beta-glucosidase